MNPLRRRRSTYVAVLLAAGACLSPGAGRLAVQAQEPPPELAPLARPIAILLVDRPTVTVWLRGDFGPIRVTGTLENPPAEPLHLVDGAGRSREARWLEVRSLSLTELPVDGLPAGSFHVVLVSDRTESRLVSSSLGGYARGGAQGTNLFHRLSKLPEGALTLKGDPYGSVTFPLSRLVRLEMQPLQGQVENLPPGQVRVALFEGSTVDLPLPRIQFFQRDLTAGSIRVVLDDEQSFAGKLVSLPEVLIPLGVDKDSPSVPLSRVAVMERTPPGGRLF